MTLDALLMAVLEQGDVSHLLRCEDGLYLASAAHLVDIRGSQPTPFFLGRAQKVGASAISFSVETFTYVTQNHHGRTPTNTFGQ